MIISTQSPYWNPILWDWFHVRSHSFFNLQLHQRRPAAFVESQKDSLPACYFAPNCTPMRWWPKTTMWCIDTMQNWDNLALSRRLSEYAPEVVVLNSSPDKMMPPPIDLLFHKDYGCCQKACLHFPFLKHRQAENSLCLDVLITRFFFLLQPETKRDGWQSVRNSPVLFLWSRQQKVQQIRCQMIFNVKRAPSLSLTSSPGCTWLHGADTPALSIQLSSNGTHGGGREERTAHGTEQEPR